MKIFIIFSLLVAFLSFRVGMQYLFYLLINIKLTSHVFNHFVIAVQSVTSHLGDKYLLTISQIYAKIQHIHQSFEIIKVKNNQAEFSNLIDQIKEQKEALGKAKAEINGVLSSLVSYQVLDKVYLEFGRIMTDSYADALNQIAFEILGHKAGVSEFKTTVVSEAINIATAFLKGSFEIVVGELSDIDQRMTTIMNHKNTTTDLFNELRVLNELSKIVEDSLHLKKQLFEVYQAEDEKALLDGKELNILQKNDVNMHVVMIDWLVQFVRTYQELIKKLIG